MAVASTAILLLVTAGLLTKRHVEEAWKNGPGKDYPEFHVAWRWEPAHGTFLPEPWPVTSEKPASVFMEYQWSWLSWSWKKSGPVTITNITSERAR